MKNNTINYEVYENNGGMLFLCILNSDGECERIFEGWEWGHDGELAEALEMLKENPDIVNDWDGDLVDRINSDGEYTTAQLLYEEGLGDLIANSAGYLAHNMGYAGRQALNR